MGYNGWSNYETWACALWLDNDHGSYLWAREIVEEADSRYEAEDALRSWVEESFIDPITEGDNHAGLAVDLLRAAFAEIDWQEIAAHYVDEDEDEGGQA